MTTFEHEIEVRFRDCDALGHVNNAVYLTYLEQARFAHWQRLTGVSGIPRSFILARVECDYRAQATAGERLVVRLHVAAVGNSSFTFEYVKVRKNPARLPDMLQHSRGRRAVPVIVEDGVVTIGFDGGT